jgi:hypothetical protein
MSLIRTGLTLAIASVLLARVAAAQGGWRQWDIYLRDGTHVEANPLGAPDDTVLATSVGGNGIHRGLIDYIAAQTVKLQTPLRNAALPPLPKAHCRLDVVVRLDGTHTYGRVTLENVRFSEGTIVQNGTEIALADVAYIRFARQP